MKLSQNSRLPQLSCGRQTFSKTCRSLRLSQISRLNSFTSPHTALIGLSFCSLSKCKHILEPAISVKGSSSVGVSMDVSDLYIPSSKAPDDADQSNLVNLMTLYERPSGRYIFLRSCALGEPRVIYHKVSSGYRRREMSQPTNQAHSKNLREGTMIGSMTEAVWTLPRRRRFLRSKCLSE